MTGESVAGIPSGRRFRRTERPVCRAVQVFFRAESVITRMSFNIRSTFRIEGTVTVSFVFSSTSSIVPMPQLGWQPHLNDPHSDSRPPSRSFRSESGPDADSGYQSRIGSPTDACAFTSCARCESV